MAFDLYANQWRYYFSFNFCVNRYFELQWFIGDLENLLFPMILFNVFGDRRKEFVPPNSKHFL